MKKYILLLGCIICLSFSIMKNKKIIPPGTIQITETFFVDETEISNFSWLEYEFYTKNKYGANSEEHVKTLPDTLVWRVVNSYNEPYVRYYYRHHAYKNYPVVGISYDQALAFCKWRTQRVKEYYYIKNKKELNIEYRLPKKEEWEMISINYPDFFANEGKNKSDEVMFNHRWMPDSVSSKYFAKHKQYADVTVPVKSYNKNSFGIYNCFGNVAEMTSEKGISKGGGWRNLFEECRSGKDNTYDKPTAWLGFRCM